jgi:RHS repeat-associated protein
MTLPGIADRLRMGTWTHVANRLYHLKNELVSILRTDPFMKNELVSILRTDPFMIYANQIVAAKYLYGPFGENLSMSGPLAPFNTPRFASKEWNDRAGIYYFGLRYYDPVLQRFLNQDPLQEEGGINLYAYAANDPINFFDALGLAPCTETDIEYADSDHWLLTKLHPNGSGSSFGLSVDSFDLTWEAKVTVLCCCNGKSERKSGTRMSDAHIGSGPWIFFDLTKIPGRPPIAKSIEDAIGKLLATALKKSLSTILPGIPADSHEAQDLLNRIEGTLPATAHDGNWKGGKSPC